VCGCGRCDLFTLVCQLTADGLHSAACDGRRCCRVRRSSKKICGGIFILVAVRPSQTAYLDHTFLSKKWMDMNEKLIHMTTVYYTCKTQVGYAGRYLDKVRCKWKNWAMDI
jgi:hypothetical protein